MWHLLAGVRTGCKSGTGAGAVRTSGTRIAACPPVARTRYEEAAMARGDKGKYTDKQKRKAEHIEESYEARGVPEDEAERRAWATVNKESGGGNKSGSGRGVPDTNVSAKRGGR